MTTTPEGKRASKRAAAKRSNSFSECVAQARDRAISGLHHHRILKLSALDALAFHRALDNPPPAGPRLQQAFRTYKALRKPV
jgi:uncharacterized protein (DUF1778 family)